MYTANYLFWKYIMMDTKKSFFYNSLCLCGQMNQVRLLISTLKYTLFQLSLRDSNIRIQTVDAILNLLKLLYLRPSRRNKFIEL